MLNQKEICEADDLKIKISYLIFKSDIPEELINRFTIIDGKRFIPARDDLTILIGVILTQNILSEETLLALNKIIKKFELGLEQLYSCKDILIGFLELEKQGKQSIVEER